MLAAAGALGGAALLGLAGPGWLPPCPFHALTGLDCPGCGTGRALAALASGDIPTAVAYNALVVLVAGPLLVWCWWCWTRARPLPRAVLSPAVGSVWAVGVTVWAVARNLPVPGLRALAA
jgi:hypothetical protein